MALTALQREVLKLISKSRLEAGESYVAGGVALNAVLPAPYRATSIPFGKSASRPPSSPRRR
jgi:hypothetical protein